MNTSNSGLYPIIIGPSTTKENNTLEEINNVNILEVTGCSPESLQLYNDVQHAIDCTIASEGPLAVSSLGKASIQAGINDQPPFSCMTQLLTGPLAACNVNISQDLRDRAAQAFKNVTGLRTLDGTNITNVLNNEQIQISNLNVIYFYLPIFIILFIGIWLMVGFGWILWSSGLFLTVFLFAILYMFSIFYRIQVKSLVNNQTNSINNSLIQYQTNIDNSIAYWPQGLYAVACSLTENGSTGTTGTESYWPCFGAQTNSNLNNVVSEENTEQNIQPLTIRKRRFRRNNN